MLPGRTGAFFVLLLAVYPGLGPFTAHAETIRYVPIGDSYSICEGVRTNDCWTVALTRQLTESGLDIELAVNPSRTGWKVEDAIESELPAFAAARPGFATLLIGVNDWVQGSGRKKFTALLETLLDRMLESLPDTHRLLVITIPDFSCAPQNPRYGYGRNISRGISRYNKIIQRQAEKRGLPVVDLFPLSQEFCNQPQMFVADGIHPSAKQYALWRDKIFPRALEILKK